MRHWQLHQAKTRLPEVIASATTEGPQAITRRGKLVAVMLSAEDYKRLTQAKPSFVEFMRQSPLCGLELDTQRERSTSRP